jgi:hypothetical protein
MSNGEMAGEETGHGNSNIFFYSHYSPIAATKEMCARQLLKSADFVVLLPF